MTVVGTCQGTVGTVALVQLHLLGIHITYCCSPETIVGIFTAEHFTIRAVGVDHVRRNVRTDGYTVIRGIATSHEVHCRAHESEVTQRGKVTEVTDRVVRAVGIGMDIAYVSAEFQVIVDFGLHVGASRDALVLRVDYHTVVAQETDRSIVLCLLRTAGSRDAVVLLPGCTGHHVLPVNLLAFAVILLAPHFVPKACAVVGTCLAQVGGILVYITNVQLVGQCLETEVGSDVDGRMSFVPCLVVIMTTPLAPAEP